jgi:uncharacterized membrane protein
MYSKKLIFKCRAIAVLSVVLVDVILYHVGYWALATMLGLGQMSFLSFSFILGVVACAFALAICSGRFDMQISRLINWWGKRSI